MYEETITGLRKIVQDYKGRLTPYMRLTIVQAVDAIEELSVIAENMNIAGRLIAQKPPEEEE